MTIHSPTSVAVQTLTREREIEPPLEGLLEHPPRPAQLGLLDQLLLASPDAAGAARSVERSQLDRFLEERSTSAALERWLGKDRLRTLAHRAAAKEDSAPAERAWRLREAVLPLLARDVAFIDELICDQLNAILHAPAFQKLEASWRGLKFLIEQAPTDDTLKVRMLNVSWKELKRDADLAVEFDQSQIFKKVYSDEFDTPGGEPYGLLIGDYQFNHHPDHVDLLARLSSVAAAAFAPFIASADPALFGVDEYSQLDRPGSLARGFEQVEYTQWNRSFREREDARFVGLTAPRVLMRTPYTDDTLRADEFRFREDVDGPDRSKYLWGSASYAFASVVMRAFMDSGWLADIRGVTRGEAGGGLVTGLPVHCFSTDPFGVAAKSSTDLIVSEDLEKELGDLGFIPLTHCKDTEYSAFYGNQSVQKPKTYDTQVATMNARLSSMLQYILCASRMAHYVKVVVREKVGSFVEASDLETYLTRWISEYVAPDREAPPEVKARFPLREARVQVRELRGRPGEYSCTMHLMPHYQLDALTASVKLTTDRLVPHRPT